MPLDAFQVHPSLIIFIIIYISFFLYKSMQWKDVRLALYGCGPVVSIGSVYLIYIFKGYQINWKLHGIFLIHVILGFFLAYDRILALKKLEAFRSHHQAILDNVADGIIITNNKGKIVLANPSVEQLFGFSEDSLKLKDIKILMTQEVSNKHDSYIDNFNQTRVPKVMGMGREVIGRRKNGTLFPLYIAVNEIIIREVQFFIASLHDLTDIKKTENELKHLSRRVIQIRDEERTRIAADIHDGLGQTLIGLKFLVHDLVHKLQTDNELQEIAQEALNQIDEAVKEGRSISHNLSPLALQKIGLPLAIKDLLHNYPTIHSKIKMEPEHIVHFFPDCWSIDLYRIIQEAVTNAIKHAKATQIHISSKYKNGSLEIGIVDNGKGFNTNAKRVNDGIGLLLMQARANFIGGNLFIDSAKNKGTEIRVVIKPE